MISDIDIAYNKTLDFLYNKLASFSKYGKSALNNSLDNILALTGALGNPQGKTKAIHIAGTNGKGSTSHMLASILQEAGYKTGLYTSPHLVDFRERIKINGVEVSKEWVIDFCQKYEVLIQEINPSFFELTVAMAFQYFAEQECDLMVIETGLGGRLDSTNIITPILSIITNISLDHTELLGNSIAQIAAEKAGIIKKGVPFIIGERDKETEQIFFEHAIQKQCNSFYADAQWGLVKINQDDSHQYLKAVKLAAKEMYDLKTDLAGSYQIYNIKTALTAAEVLFGMGFQLDMETCIRGLSKVKTNTKLTGRWEKIQSDPSIWIDVGHNEAGIKQVMQQWNILMAERKHVLLGFVRDKDVRAALSLLPTQYNYHFCNANIPRALPAQELASIALEFGIEGKSYPNVSDALVSIRKELGPEDALLITGSFFVVGEAITFLEGLPNG